MFTDMKSFILLGVSLLGSASLLTSVHAAPDFATDIQPVLEGACIRCHGPEKDRGDLQMHTREDMVKGGEGGASLVPGNAAESELIKRVSLSHDSGDIMPAKGEPLSEKEIKHLTDWVNAGAVWPEGVTLVKRERGTDKKNEKAALPLTGNPSDQVDGILEFENREHTVVVADSLDDMAFLRRTTIDLIGRIPTMEEIVQYRMWPESTRRKNLIDGLLANDRFADRWTIFFSDILRIRTNADGGKNLLAYINQSIREGKPWDRLAHELISKNGRPVDHPAAAFALGDGADPMEMTAATAQVFMGVRMMCAQCHNHPFDEWDQKQFYEMAGFFGKTEVIENNFGKRTIYTTEGKEMQVKWPPERLKPPTRTPVTPKFPFQLEEYTETPSHIARLEEKRSQEQVIAKKEASIDELLDNAEIDLSSRKKAGPGGFDLLADLKQDKAGVDIEGDLYRQSLLREQLADMITDPRNRYFSRAMVNRVWAELLGKGFYEPVDNFTDISQVSHPQTMDFLADEFVASGYDVRSLIRIIMNSEAYQRGNLPGDTDSKAITAAEARFTTSISRRMLSEVLYDSVVTAGHLFHHKWPKGANVKTIEKEIRVSLDPSGEVVSMTESGGATTTMQNMTMQSGSMQPISGYQLEETEALDFGNILREKAETKAETKAELMSMKAAADKQLKRQQMMAAMAEAAKRPKRYTYKTVTETIDDNPKFTSATRMATPAPPAHFLRVFGQPSRDSLGEFREHTPSMRQYLMMLNGKATYESARIGPKEKLYDMLSGKEPQVGKAIRYAYMEALTRMPNDKELGDAEMIVSEAASPLEGMADLRWALLNCHEFKYLP